MMYGIPEKFLYFQCGDCGCVQLAEVPEDLTPYYGGQNREYYSLEIEQRQSSTNRNWVKEWLKTKRRDYVFKGEKNYLGAMLNRVRPLQSKYVCIVGHLVKYQQDEKLPVLDVGCGAGEMLNLLSDLGYKNVQGCDKFVGRDLVTAYGAQVFCRDIFGVEGTFQSITMRHSFEHMDEPLAILKKARQLLAADGTLLIEIPVVGYTWEKYREFCQEIDAPRHLFLHTTRSMEILSKSADLKIVESVYNGDSSQFIVPELYKKGIPHREHTAERIQREFSKEKLKQYEQLAKELNLKKQGATILFVLKKNM